MPVERRGQVIALKSGQPATGGTRYSTGRRQPSRGGTSRMTRECQVRICERLGVQFPGPTRQFPGPTRQFPGPTRPQETPAVHLRRVCLLRCSGSCPVKRTARSRVADSWPRCLLNVQAPCYRAHVRAVLSRPEPVAYARHSERKMYLARCWLLTGEPRALRRSKGCAKRPPACGISVTEPGLSHFTFFADSPRTIAASSHQCDILNDHRPKSQDSY